MVRQARQLAALPKVSVMYVKPISIRVGRLCPIICDYAPEEHSISCISILTKFFKENSCFVPKLTKYLVKSTMESGDDQAVVRMLIFHHVI